MPEDDLQLDKQNIDKKLLSKKLRITALALAAIAFVFALGRFIYSGSYYEFFALLTVVIALAVIGSELLGYIGIWISGIVTALAAALSFFSLYSIFETNALSTNLFAETARLVFILAALLSFFNIFLISSSLKKLYPIGAVFSALVIMLIIPGGMFAAILTAMQAHYSALSYIAICFLGMLIFFMAIALFHIYESYLAQKQLLQVFHATKKNLLTNVSHEIRTPLHGIIGSASILNTTDLTPKQQRLVAILTLSARQILSLINDILDAAKLEVGLFPIEFAPVDFRAFCFSLKEQFNRSAVERGVHLHLHYPETVPSKMIMAIHPVKMVFVKLLENALTSTREGHVNINLNILENNGEIPCLQISIKDTGVGIPENMRDIIFNKFSRHNTHSEVYEGGSGLGLFLAKSLIEKIEGKIWFNSRLNEGTTFHVTFPVKLITEEITADAAK